MSRTLLNFGIALAIFVASGTSYALSYGAVSTQSAHAADLAAQIAAKKSSLTRIASTKATVNSLQSEELAMQQYFVSENTIVNFIGALQGEGQKLGAAVTVDSVSANTQGARPTLTLSLTVDGTFDAVLRTVGAIEHAPYDITDSNFSLQNRGKGAWEARFTIVVGSIPGGVSASGSSANPQPSSLPRTSIAPSGPQPL